MVAWLLFLVGIQPSSSILLFSMRGRKWGWVLMGDMNWFLPTPPPCLATRHRSGRFSFIYFSVFLSSSDWSQVCGESAEPDLLRRTVKGFHSMDLNSLTSLMDFRCYGVGWVLSILGTVLWFRSKIGASNSTGWARFILKTMFHVCVLCE